MPRVRTYFYDPAKLEGRIDTGSGSDEPSGVINKRSVLQQAREKIEVLADVSLTPMEALMRCAPHMEPSESLLEREARMEPLRHALSEVLTERERWIIEAIFWRRMALRQLEKELAISKTQIARIRDHAVRKLREAMGGVD